MILGKQQMETWKLWGNCNLYHPGTRFLSCRGLLMPKMSGHKTNKSEFWVRLWDSQTTWPWHVDGKQNNWQRLSQICWLTIKVVYWYEAMSGFWPRFLVGIFHPLDFWLDVSPFPIEAPATPPFFFVQTCFLPFATSGQNPGTQSTIQ